jgi:hypothetical protein
MDAEDGAPAIPTITVDWTSVAEAVSRRAWLLTDVKPRLPGFDDLRHTDRCNLSPVYQSGRSPDDVAKLIKYGCDCQAIKRWYEEQEGG